MNKTNVKTALIAAAVAVVLIYASNRSVPFLGTSVQTAIGKA